jgi:DNA-binding transcriptional ArsR family regulator
LEVQRCAILDTVRLRMADRTTKPITNVDDPRYVKALTHPLRIRILALLEEREASPVQLAEHLDATLGTVAYHVRTLQKLGLIELVATHQRRGATEHVYAAREHPRFSDSAWAATSPLTKHAMVSAILSQIGEYATQSATAGGFDRPDTHITRSALKLDETGWSELARASKDWLAQVSTIETQAQRRLERSGEPGFDAGLVILLFEALPFFDVKPDGDGAARKGSMRQRPSRAART